MASRTHLWGPTAAVVLLGLTSCGGPDAVAPPVPPSEAATSTAVAVATPKPTAAVVPTKAQDLAAAKQSAMTASVLGKPWVAPKKVNTSGGKANEACPGKPALDVLAPPRVRWITSFTRGTKPGASIARFTVVTVPDAGTAHRAAWARTAKACKTYQDAAGLYVVTALEGPTTASGADDAVSRTERVYYDADHRRLAYARHFISARTGRAITTLEYDFLAPKSDPRAKDFTPAQALLALQLPRTRTAFPS